MSPEASEKTNEMGEDQVQGAPEVEVASTEATVEAEAGLEHDGATELAAFKKENERLAQELADLKDQFMRKAAEMDNFRKRLLRDKEEAVLFANKEILSDLVPVIDNFERAIKSSETARDYDALYQGIVMIESQFTSMLESKYGLKRVHAVGQAFDPSIHEAVMLEPRDDHSEQTVLETFEAGYVLQERVLRTAKVKVSQPGS